MENTSMGKLIQTLRKAKGMTQRDLAEQLNVTDRAVSKWERDVARPDIDILQQLAMALGTTVSVLLNAQEETEPSLLNEIAETAQSDEAQHDTNLDFNSGREQYRARSIALLRQGIVGFVVGSIGFLIAFLITVFNSASFNVWEIPALLLLAIVSGLFFAGIPYGWCFIRERTDQWVIYGNFFAILFLLMLRIIGTCAVAMVGYPIALIYNLIRSQKSRKNMKISFVVCGVASVAYIIFAILMALSQ